MSESVSIFLVVVTLDLQRPAFILTLTNQVDIDPALNVQILLLLTWHTWQQDMTDHFDKDISVSLSFSEWNIWTKKRLHVNREKEIGVVCKQKS